MNLHHAKNVETQPFISFSFVIFTVHILTYQTTRQFTTSPQCILNKIVEEFLNLVYILCGLQLSCLDSMVNCVRRQIFSCPMPDVTIDSCLFSM